MTSKKALFPGSFDPFTNGHLNTVERASTMFDEIIISVATNTSKQALFTPEEKKRLIEQATSHLPNISVCLQSFGLTVEQAKQLDAQFLLRGIRNHQDFEYEKSIAFMNKQLNESIETVFLLADEQYSSISSTMIKEIAKFNGDISKFVPQGVNQAIKEKLI
ncbi:pantetheine-phosphate adenylyltransferase [Vagococcus penaei]|uniref:Phosphopantetheine adenylyltransferase n=1 Tax=Vagococcus penaei TaxID=633807 RepID=A0A1Q2D4B6_9ENTE|nr:pantetheine-phosphate adenylyltransferase [Vagococcus penaei]AQP53236.1 pantetheine-phosphate adenylyltransferase [Vagococcus penaei]RST98682.1 pantetheine-phosphate adenylyltransferase [Vagococcus penaei]